MSNENDPDQNPKYVEQTEEVEHPLEEFFDIESGTTEHTEKSRVPQTTEQPEDFDQKDTEIDENFQEIYDAAMDAFEKSFQARSRESAAQFLNAALAAAGQKSHLKQHKDKIKQKLQQLQGQQSNVVQGNETVVIDRNEMLREMRKQYEEHEVVDGQYTEEQTEQNDTQENDNE